MSKTILLDADGVMLNWEYAFHIWLDHHGHDPVVMDQGLFYRVADQYGMEDEKAIRLVKLFNESASIGFLPAMRDAVQYISLLHKQGFHFHVITSVGTDENVVRLRKQNLVKLFGDIFDEIDCLPMGSRKNEYLSIFKDTGFYWIEDNVQNAEDGLNFGLKPILMEHGYNMKYKNPDIPLVKNWKEIYELLVS